MKFSRSDDEANSLPMLKQLNALIEHWESMAAESENQGQISQQNPLFRGQAYGISDGLRLAANELREQIKILQKPSKS